MFNIITGKIKLSPNEVKTILLPKYKYKNNPVVFLTSISGNNSFTLEKSSKRCFIVSNNTQKNIILNYVVNEGKINSSLSQIRNDLFIQGEDATITVLDYYINDEIFDLGIINANNYFNYTEGEEITYELISVIPTENPEGSLFNHTNLFFDESGILNLNSEMIYFNDVTFQIKGMLSNDNSINDIVNITLNFVDQLYQTNNQALINYNSASSLNNYLQHEILYSSSGSGESSAGFFIPELSENAEENFFVFSTNFTISPSLELGILSNNIPIYKTTNPDDALNNSIAANDQGFPAYTYVVLLEDQNNYYFWYNINDQVWYVSSERFPLNYDS